MFSSVFSGTWHELIFGTLLANIFLLFGFIRYVFKLVNKYKRKMQYFFEKISIMWFEYGSRRYPNLSALEIHNKLNKELDEYVERSE